jgi:two-component system nitrate/nitrite response regulator NarL
MASRRRIGHRERMPTGAFRIVIADDHPVYRDGIVRALMETGRYEIVGEAGDGAAALRFILQREPDVALLDLRMPTLDALAVLRRLRDEGVDIPVVLVSAFTQPQIVEQALEAGAAGYLSKDAAREEIVVALDAAALRGRIVKGR